MRGSSWGCTLYKSPKHIGLPIQDRHRKTILNYPNAHTFPTSRLIVAKATIDAPVAIFTRQNTARITHLEIINMKSMPVSVKNDFRISSAV